MAAKPIKVSQLNSYIKRVLQADPLLGNISVTGEISNLKHHSSGHVYFSLKDETSRINCFLAADNARHIRYELSYPCCRSMGQPRLFLDSGQQRVYIRKMPIY